MITFLQHTVILLLRCFAFFAQRLLNSWIRLELMRVRIRARWMSIRSNTPYSEIRKNTSMIEIGIFKKKEQIMQRKAGMMVINKCIVGLREGAQLLWR